MNKLILSILSLTSFAGTAFAADLTSMKEPVAVPSLSPIWTGFYAGVNIGGTWSNNNQVNLFQNEAYAASGPLNSTTVYNATLTGFLSSQPIQTNNSASLIGGGQVGYISQINDKFITGAEADIQGIAGPANNSRSTFEAFSFPYYAESVQRYGTQSVTNFFSVSKSIDYIGTARGRLGYLLTPTIAIYGTAGLAYGGTNIAAFAIQKASNGATYGGGPGGSSISSTNLGWSAGGGVEWMFMNNWSAKAEYLYYDLGSRSVFMGPTVGVWGGPVNIPGVSTGQVISVSHYNASAHFNGNIVRAGVNYHFNLASPPVIANF